jgi:hypothetical protein
MNNYCLKLSSYNDIGQFFFSNHKEVMRKGEHYLKIA